MQRYAPDCLYEAPDVPAVRETERQNEREREREGRKREKR